MSWPPSCMPARRSRIATIVVSRAGSTLVASRRGVPYASRRPAPASSTSTGREPTTLGTTHEPLGRSPRSARKSAEGSAISCRPRVVHREDADLVDAAEAVLVGAHDAVLAGRVAFEVEHGVDEVLEQPRPGDRTVLGDVPDDEDRATGALGELHQRLRAVADLRDAAGVRLDLGQRHRLNRVDRPSTSGDAPLALIEDRAQVRLGEHQQIVGRADRARRAFSSAPPTPRRNVERASPPRSASALRFAAAASTCRRRAVRRAAPGCRRRARRRAARRTRRTPLLRRATRASAISESRSGPRAGRSPVTAAPSWPATIPSTNVFHASHCGQRPSQRAETWPHAEQV